MASFSATQSSSSRGPDSVVTCSSSGPTIGMTRCSSMKESRSSHASSSSVGTGACMVLAEFIIVLFNLSYPKPALDETPDCCMPLSPFHLAVQVRDIGEAREFYGGLMGCAEGRSAALWVDFDFFGHQLVCHLNPALGAQGRIASHYNPVDGDQVP